MLSRLFITLSVMAGLAIAQTDKDIDTLLARYYHPLGQVNYECYPVATYPHFAIDEPLPPFKNKWKHYTTNSYNYYKFYDREGFHFIFSGISYYPEKEKMPKAKTYSMFFYTTSHGHWIQEMEPLVATFDLTGDMTYVPRPHGIELVSHYHPVMVKKIPEKRLIMSSHRNPTMPVNRFEFRFTQ